jgi:hypothetical protein
MRQMTEIALRSAGQVYDLQMAAARALMQTQARMGAAFGWPDWSGALEQTDHRARQVFGSGIEQCLKTADLAGQAVVELQRQIGRVVERQAALAAESWQRGIEEIGEQTEQSLAQLQETARQQANEAARTADALAETTRDAVRQNSERWREQMRHGFERNRQAMAQAGDEARRGAEQAREAQGD